MATTSIKDTNHDNKNNTKILEHCHRLETETIIYFAHFCVCVCMRFKCISVSSQKKIGESYANTRHDYHSWQQLHRYAISANVFFSSNSKYCYCFRFKYLIWVWLDCQFRIGFERKIIVAYCAALITLFESIVRFTLHICKMFQCLHRFSRTIAIRSFSLSVSVVDCDCNLL